MLLFEWNFTASGDDHDEDRLVISRDPLRETIAYVQSEERKVGVRALSVDQTQFLLDALWKKVVCREAIDPVLCQGVGLHIASLSFTVGQMFCFVNVFKTFPIKLFRQLICT